MMNEISKDQPNKKTGSVYFGVKFRSIDYVYSIQKVSIPVKLNDKVVVETSRGQEFGVISLRTEQPNINKDKQDLIVKRVNRLATEADIANYEKLSHEEQEVFIECIRKNSEYHYPVKFFKVEKIFDGSRYIIYYKFNDGDNSKKQHKKKLSMHPLVNELSNQLNAKIEFREVGSRGEAKIFGGMGSCGKSLCCASWDKRGASVTIKMAKEQGLAINIPKLSGCCGRLICCLSYEKDNYQDGDFIRD